MTNQYVPIHLSEIDSTHKYALNQLTQLSDKSVIVSTHQTSGVGRHGRSWLSSPGESLLMSIVLKPQILPQRASLITPVLALAAVELLKAYKISANIQWPNDILVGDKKIAGILSQAIVTGSELAGAVVSMGLNVKQSQKILKKVDRPATSIFVETGNTVEPKSLIDPLIEAFEPLYESLLEDGFGPILPRYRTHLNLMNHSVILDLGGSYVKGSVKDVDENGALLIADDSGNVRPYHSGEVVRLIKN
ncbi:biotin--[acetyl-CoA-carboxylase] ligase [bacterium]|nr:biotin--[acetyl-CoA-carboxylase] ligase [bacterium]